MTTYGYARVSRAKQDVDNQHDYLVTQGCDSENIVLETASGKSDRRKNFNALLSQLERGDVVIARQLDRLSRRTLTLLQIRDQFEKGGVQLIADKKQYDFNNYTDRMLFGIQAVMAEYESDLNGERVKSAIVARGKNKGYKNVGRPSALSPRQKLEVYKGINSDLSKSMLADRYNVARSTITKAYEEVAAKKEVDAS
ncbi:MAG: recombinase family protein [Micrococcaceae bacterium]